MNATATNSATGTRVIESIVLRGDLSGLGPTERAKFYTQMCESLGLNPHAQPFAFLKLNGKEVLYATRGATDQLAAIHKVNREMVDGPKLIDLGGTKLIYGVCRATHPNGRVETATATVPFVDPVNVMMKCETKAKRRATLSLLALSVLDESELESIPAGVQSPGTPVDLSSESPAAIDPRTPIGLFEIDLGNVSTLGELIAAWHSHAQELHRADETQRATELVGDWLGAHGYCATATEQQHILARAWPIEALTLADELSRISAPELVVTWYLEKRAATAQLSNADAFRTFIGRSWCARAGVETTRVVDAFHAAVMEALPRPEELTAFLGELERAETADECVGLWKKHRAAIAALEELLRRLAWVRLVTRVEAVGNIKNANAWLKKVLDDTRQPTPPGMPVAQPAAPAQPQTSTSIQPVVTSRGDVLDTEEKCSQYVRNSITVPNHLESAARKYGSHPWMIGPLVNRLAALRNITTDEADVLVEKWSKEGPKAATKTEGAS